MFNIKKCITELKKFSYFFVLITIFVGLQDKFIYCIVLPQGGI